MICNCGRLYLAMLMSNKHLTIYNRVVNFQTLVRDLRLFFILQTFPRPFFIYASIHEFFTSLHKTTASTLKFQYFHSFLQKFWWTQTKAFCWHLLCLSRPMACGNRYIEHFAKFPDFFKTHCWQPWLIN